MEERALIQIDITNLKHLRRGKVREIFDLQDRLLIVATDRISAFDVVLPDGIPGKGKILTGLSKHWFKMLEPVASNHLISMDPEDLPVSPEERNLLAGRFMIVKKAVPLEFECIVRGYLVGSGYKEYCSTGHVSGIPLPEGLKQGDKFPEPLFTPSTKAEQGDHDEPVSLDCMADAMGKEKTEWVKNASIELYSKAQEYAHERGIIIADTKFEFGAIGDELILIDEVLTPDSSRFWPRESWAPGKPGVSLDKQYVRDFLSNSGWEKKPPAPRLPQEVIDETARRYQDILVRLTA